jgi:hypothetical protein
MDTVNIEKYTPDWIRELYGIKAPTNAKALNNKTGQASAPAQTNTKAVNMFEGPPKLSVGMLNSLKTSAMAYAPTLPGGLALSGVGSFKQIAAYLLAIVIIIGIILVVIHTFITPIFQFQPGAPGIIPVGMDDGQLFWKTDMSELKDADLQIKGTSSNYSLNVDLFIENPAFFSKAPRILFMRGGELIPSVPLTTSMTLLSILRTYNIAVALEPDTTDLIVSVLDTNTQSQDIKISNVPVQKSFRLGIIVMEHALEVYMNNKLINTKALLSPPKSVMGDITVPTKNLVKMRNLKIWNRVLSSPEIRNASPAITSDSDFNAQATPSTASCS